MKKKLNGARIASLLTLLFLITLSTISFTNSGGAPGGHTAAPGEINCTTCHAGTLQTSGTNYNNISLTGDFTGNGYIPDSTYTITFSYTHSGKSKFGYQLTCLDNADKMAGSFALISGNNKSRINSKTINGSLRNYMNHTSSGNSGSGSNKWEFEWTAPSSNLGEVKFYTVVNSANGSGTGGDIIIAREFTINPSDSLPEVTASSSSTTICAGELVELKGSTTDSVSKWAWSISGASPSSSSTKDVDVRFQNPGKYNAILIGSNHKGPSEPDTVKIEVLAQPNAFISGPSLYIICKGDSIKIEVGSGSGNTYKWNTGETTTEIWAKDKGEYYVDVTNLRGCGRQSNRISVRFRPEANFGIASSAQPSNDTLCSGSPITLWSDNASFDSFYFYTNDLLSSVSEDSFSTLSFDSTSTYGLQVKDAFGCLSSIKDYTVFEIKRPDAPILSCETEDPSTIDFQWSSITAHQGYEVSIDSGKSWIDPSSGAQGLKHTVTGLSSGDSVNLLLRAFTASPCNFSKVADVTCFSKECDPLPISVNFDSSICRGDLWTVEVNGLSGMSYSLQLDGGGLFTDTIFSFNPSVSNEYVIEVKDSSDLGCPATKLQLPLVVDAIFDIQLKADKVGAFCQEEEVTFSANDSIENFDFYLNGSVVQSGPSNEFTFNNFRQNDSIYVVVSKGECLDTSEKKYINVELPANPNFTFTRDWSVYTFQPVVTTHALYTWDFGDGSSASNDVSPEHDYANVEGTTVNVVLDIVSDAGCDTSSSQIIELPVFSNVKELENLGIRYYPNPVSNVLIVENESGLPMGIEITSLDGKVLLQKGLFGTRNVANTSELAKGIYLLKIDLKNQTRTLRFLKN